MVCHRRWGKDEIALHWAATQCMQKPATYWHMLPEASQARKAVWKAVNPHTGKRRIDEAFPLSIRRKTNDQEMFIEFVTGATWQVVGSDNFNSLVGSPPMGITFSEWSISNPMSWAYLSPILAENGGWALFVYTSRGKNHGYTVYQRAVVDPEWLAVKHTVDDTDVFNLETLEGAHQDLVAIYGKNMGDALFRQEYYCSFDSAVIGSYYGDAFCRLDTLKRITSVPIEPQLPVHTAWDLGMSDSTVIWFFQRVGSGEIRIIDYYEHSGAGLEHYAKVLRDKEYYYGTHIAPHDISVREMGTGKSRLEVAQSMGINFHVARNNALLDGIQAVRTVLPRCWFDDERCSQGIEALRQYRTVYDESRRTFQIVPLHDWTSHAADAFRYLALEVDSVQDAGMGMTADMAKQMYEQYARPVC